ncbi:TATA-binding protein-associated factor 172 [Phlebotomus argentipes]|uniref:TATA-binding protein-associated factor 172 n=1 Tax=Phlebotomus argentipes TaxID=94469 RepID=UPI0028930359|nr:TATA-binding protein-associated factor 172 [Phlebotomus argentipes]
MTSRLDRLFILLESGSSAVTRRTAAKQIGEVQRLHPHELHNLLNRVIAYMHNSSWDTRIAAAQTVEAILNNVPQFLPVSGVNQVEATKDEKPPATQLQFATFDLVNMLLTSGRLMGSEGNEFDFQDDIERNSKERLMMQREIIREKLGFAKGDQFGIALEELVTLDDVRLEASTSESRARLTPLEDGNNMTDTATSSLSCREKNRAKRKARQGFLAGTYNRSNSTNGGGSLDVPGEPPEKKKKIKDNLVENPINYSYGPVPDGTGSWGDATAWPFEAFCTKLYSDLFNPRWETRHGAATALRELFKAHSESAGKICGMSVQEMENSHTRWLEDAVLRLLCVLALDRFGDFVSDQVIAPVRETCAQVLGTLLKQMPEEKINSTVEILLRMIKHEEWEVRHGGLLGIKYLLVVREDLLQNILPALINDILMGLFDQEDDVGAVAAATLIPIASWLPKLLKPMEVSRIVKMLWDLLLDQDELTSASNSFMGLLAAILSLPNASNWIQMESMSVLVPRLWPFLSHSSSSVRRSTLLTMKTLTQVVTVSEDAVLSADGSGKEESPAAEALVLNIGVKNWDWTLLQEALRHIFQRVLIEHVEDVQSLAEMVWENLVLNSDLSALLHATCPFVASWLCLAMQPMRLAFDPASLIYVRVSGMREKKGNRSNLVDTTESVMNLQQKVYLGGTETVPQDVREKNVDRARYKACRMLGLLSKFLVLPAPGIAYTEDIESPVNCYAKVLLGHLSSRSALQRSISAMVISFWALEDSTIRPGPEMLRERLKLCLNECIYYDEVGILFTRLLQDSRDFLATLKQYKVPLVEYEGMKVLTLEQIQALATTVTENLRQKHNLKPKVADMVESRRKGLQVSCSQTSTEQNIFNIATQAALAGAVVCLNCLPERLNPVIKPIMESLKREEVEIMQQLSSQYLVRLLEQIIERNPCPNNKIITNLGALLKTDTDFTPKIVIPPESYEQNRSADEYHGILTLSNQEKALIVQNGQATRGPGRPPAVSEVTLEEMREAEDPQKKINRVQRIGATFAIAEICRHFGVQLKEKTPRIWELMTDFMREKLTKESTPLWLTMRLLEEQMSELMTALQITEVAFPNLHMSLQEQLFDLLLPKMSLLIGHPLKAIRHMVARCLAIFASVNSAKVMGLLMETVIPLLNAIESVINRQGAIEVIVNIVNKLQFQIVPYVVLLVVPLLGRMSDPDQSVRLISTHCFATLIQLMPLDGSTPDLPTLTDELRERKMRDKEFLEYLFTPKTIPDYRVPTEVKAELRSYQQAGVNWLWFLNKYKLHGILCDDMGLGKTLQTICILAGDHKQRAIDKLPSIPSIVICPPTLTGHWVYEFNKFLPQRILKPLHYVGLPVDRERLRLKMASHNLVVASYDIVRKDIDFFGKINWNYCVLDEGHVIKNGKTKCSKAIKQLVANHRLILSGTPIQNNVLELWSLFDFLMPGFLGTEKQFVARFSRPILASRDAKSSPKEQEAGALAMEALHRQVLPFLLRRVKEDVLTDLPPKITQDLLCELSPLQERLYEDFSKTHFNTELQDCIDGMGSEVAQKRPHVFQALRYLQNVCNHPKLVLNANHPEFVKIQAELARSNGSLSDIEHSAKLPALKQLLIDCGIGNWDVSINQHRALIFCQSKAMLDIVEHDLLKKHLQAVSYLRLDGSVPAGNRHEIVTKFNSDPSIDVLLLTTLVGGLGLNLTGADTVIFVEHDWNPMKDLQAMDRAHRIGQRKVVNVYRLITRKSLEEKIMCLQKFKLLTANTVVSNENASMETMGTDQLLDLFKLTDQKASPVERKGPNDRVSMKTVLETLPELWEDREYEEEYDLTQFLDKLKK